MPESCNLTSTSFSDNILILLFKLFDIRCLEIDRGEGESGVNAIWRVNNRLSAL